MIKIVYNLLSIGGVRYKFSRKHKNIKLSKRFYVKNSKKKSRFKIKNRLITLT
jgi:hypothetical protein